MTESPSVRIDSETKKHLDALAKGSKSFLAPEGIACCIESEEWQRQEMQAGISELDAGHTVSHEKVSKWLKSWANVGDSKAQR
jgi:predicted transcriptional regulator